MSEHLKVTKRFVNIENSYTSHMDNASFRKELLEAVRRTTKDLTEISKELLTQGKEDDDNYFPYEAKYKAHLYHYLLACGVSHQELAFEWMQDNSKTKHDHFDLWYRDLQKKYNTLIEVKYVSGLNRSKSDIRKPDYRTYKDGKLASGIIYDVIKLHNACKGNKNGNEYHGIKLMYLAEPKIKDNLELSNISHSIMKQVAKEANNRPENVELLWTSKKRTEYISFE